MHASLTLIMRALITRVLSASVVVDGAVVGSIERGLLVLLGAGSKDGSDDSAWIIKKILEAKVFNGAEDGKAWSESARSLGLPVLIVSQFTLHASLKAAKPDFKRAAGTGVAQELYSSFLESLRSEHGAERVATGVFGAMMQVSSINDGPVTLWIDSKNRKCRTFEDDAEAGEGGGGGGGGGGCEVASSKEH